MAGDGGVPGGRVGQRGPLDRDRAGQHPGRPAERLLEEVGGLEHRVGDAERVRLGPADHLVLVERVLDDQLQRGGRADEPGQQVGAAPAGDQAEEALGEGDHRHAGGDRAVGAVQRDLEPAAERDPVDEAERRHRQLAQPAEDRVAERPDAGRPLPRDRRVDAGGGDRRARAVQVGAGREDERLAGHADGGDLARRRPGGDRVEGRVERQQPLRAERARLGVVVPVVQGDQREHADGPEVDVADGRAGHHLAREGVLGENARQVLDSRHRWRSPWVTKSAGRIRGTHGPFDMSIGIFQIRSHKTVPPMPMPTHMVVMP